MFLCSTNKHEQKNYYVTSAKIKFKTKSEKKPLKEEVNIDSLIIELLKKISKSLEELNEKIDKLIEKTSLIEVKSKKISIENLPLDAATLLSLPDHLRKTAIAICSLGEATAEEVAEETKRARAVESDYLNQLVALGYLKKRRIGKKVYFSIEEKKE